jgi:hypothetical protein
MGVGAVGAVGVRGVAFFFFVAPPPSNTEVVLKAAHDGCEGALLASILVGVDTAADGAARVEIATPAAAPPARRHNINRLFIKYSEVVKELGWEDETFVKGSPYTTETTPPPSHRGTIRHATTVWGRLKNQGNLEAQNLLNWVR